MLTGQVFVSHTCDMARFPRRRPFVQAVLDAVSRAGMAPVDMRYFAAREGKPADYCRARVRECEIYVAVVGFRYGTIVPGEAVSYTELEFDEASVAGLPRLVFLLEDSANRPGALADLDRGAAEGFRQRLRDGGLVVRGFSSDTGLELEVFHALTDLTCARGVVPSSLAVRYSLPPDTAAFTGRAGELGLITAAFSGGAGTGGVVPVHAIGGLPGAGKTALAVHAAHLLKDRFPDRQLFIDLHGHTPGQEPLSPEAALAGLLAASGIDARALPRDLKGRTDLWRDKMDGQRAVLVLDNAASSAQVTPLLPAGGNCLVLVTSRRHLGDLPVPVVTIAVDALPSGQAQDMFLQMAPRAATEPAAAVAELAWLAGRLPLAISLLARVYARHTSWTLADLVAETRASVLTLAAENDSVAAVFEVSYQYLDPVRQQFFRCLGLHPGTTTDRYAAAALAGIPLSEAAGHLDALHGEGLLTETGYRRYGMHDLIRLYARDLAAADPAPSRDEALDRLLSYYEQAGATAQALLIFQPATKPAASAAPSAAVPSLPDREAALEWARAERCSLIACLDYAARAGQHARVVALTAAMSALLRQDGPWAEAITRHAAAAQCARHLGDRQGRANALTELGTVRWLAGDYRGAAEAQEEALGIYHDLGYRPGQGNALTELGAARRRTGYYQASAEILQEALSIYRELGDERGQAYALTELGAARRETGAYEEGAKVLEEALGLCRNLGDRPCESTALTLLGAVRWQTGDYRDATKKLNAALSICRDLSLRLGEGDALTRLGAARRQTGDYQGAGEALETALGIHRDLGNRRGQAHALAYLGVVRRRTGDYKGAGEALETALGLCRDIGDRGAQAEILNELGTLQRDLGDLDLARVFHRQALSLAREIGGFCCEASALAGLGRCAVAAGRTADANASLRQALEIFQRIGAAETAGVAVELEALAATGSAVVSSDSR
jgi:tetratricopeptide (TPR) repeat protein